MTNYDTHYSSQETCSRDLNLDYTNLLLAKNVNFAKADAEVSCKRWNESALSAAMGTQPNSDGGSADISIQDRFSNLISSSQTRREKQEDQARQQKYQAWKQQVVVEIACKDYYKQGE